MVKGFHTSLLALALILPVAPACAHFPAVFGRDFERLDNASGDHLPVPGSHRKALARIDPEELQRYHEALQDAEQDKGPYAPQLSEPLSALALLYLNAGRYTEAEAMYRKALHVERVNDGLQGERQRVLVDALMNLYREQGATEKLDQANDYRFRLYGSGLPPYSAARAQASLDYLDWQREALALAIDSENTGRLVHLYQVNRRMLEALEQEEYVDPDFHLQLVLSQLQNLYLILGELPVEEQPGRGSFMAEAPPAKFGSLDAARQRLKTIQHTGVTQGRHLLQGYLDGASDLAPETRTAVRMHLADWLQWNEYYQSAQEEYRAIIAELIAAGETSRYEQWFATPVELPSGDIFAPEIDGSPDRSPIEVQANFRVSARGSVSNIDVIAASEDNQGRAHRLVQALRETHFRPRYTPTGDREAWELERGYRLYR